jgi:hypothetical protein
MLLKDIADLSSCVKSGEGIKTYTSTPTSPSENAFAAALHGIMGE